MAEIQNPTSIKITVTAPETEEGLPRTKPYVAHLRDLPPRGPIRIARSRGLARHSPYTTSRHLRARAPSPPNTREQLSELPSTFCLLMDCNIKVPHNHTTREFQEKLGWTPTAKDVRSGTLTITPITPDQEGLLGNLCLKITTWRTPSRTTESNGGQKMVGSLLDSHSTGAEDLRSALPNVAQPKKRWHSRRSPSANGGLSFAPTGTGVGPVMCYPVNGHEKIQMIASESMSVAKALSAKNLPRSKQWAFTRGGFVPVLDKGELVTTRPFNWNGEVQKVTSEASSHDISTVTNRLAGINIKSKGESSTQETMAKGTLTNFQSRFTGSGYV